VEVFGDLEEGVRGLIVARGQHGGAATFAEVGEQLLGAVEVPGDHHVEADLIGAKNSGLFQPIGQHQAGVAVFADVGGEVDRTAAGAAARGPIGPGPGHFAEVLQPIVEFAFGQYRLGLEGRALHQVPGVERVPLGGGQDLFDGVERRRLAVPRLDHVFGAAPLLPVAVRVRGGVALAAAAGPRPQFGLTGGHRRASIGGGDLHSDFSSQDAPLSAPPRAVAYIVDH
jgi:hypothetical protein